MQRFDPGYVFASSRLPRVTVAIFKAPVTSALRTRLAMDRLAYGGAGSIAQADARPPAGRRSKGAVAQSKKIPAS
ncbi:hypothetical protein [Streptomyces sp. NPDC005141]